LPSLATLRLWYSVDLLNAFQPGMLKFYVADLNSMEQRPQKSMVLFKPSSTANAEGNDLTDGNLNINLKPVLELDWFDHPLGM